MTPRHQQKGGQDRDPGGEIFEDGDTMSAEKLALMTGCNAGSLMTGASTSPPGTTETETRRKPHPHK